MQSMVTLYCTALTTTSMTFATPEEHDLTNHFAKLNKARGSAGWFGAYESFTILKLPSLFLGAAYVSFKRVLMKSSFKRFMEGGDTSFDVTITPSMKAQYRVTYTQLDASRLFLTLPITLNDVPGLCKTLEHDEMCRYIQTY